MRLSPIQRLLKNLKGEIPGYMRREYLPKEVAHEKLRAMTGQGTPNGTGPILLTSAIPLVLATQNAAHGIIVSPGASKPATRGRLKTSH